MSTRATYQKPHRRHRAPIRWSRVAYIAGGVLAVEVGFALGLIVKMTL